MFKSNKLVKIFALLAVVAPLAMVGCKGRGHHGMSPKHVEKMEKRIASKLDLNEAQKVKLSAITAELKKIMAEKQSGRGEDIEFAKTQIKADKLNTAEIRSFLEQKQEDHVAIFERLSPKIVDFHASLNAEQKAEMVEFLDKVKERFPSRE